MLPLDNPLRMRVTLRMAPPSWEQLAGPGRVRPRRALALIWGARASLTVAFLSAALAAVIGTALGIVGGFLRGLPEWLTMRSMDVLLCFPPLLLALLAVALCRAGRGDADPGAGLHLRAGLHPRRLCRRAQRARAGLCRGGALARREAGAHHVEDGAAECLGPILVQFSLVVSTAIVLESGLSFLGLGVVPPTPSWGQMIGAARATMNQQPLLLLWPCSR
jgi:peptide/nickel transport system permease protein